MTKQEKDEASWHKEYLKLMGVHIEARRQITDVQRSNQKLSVGRAEEEEGKEKYSPSPSSTQPSWKGRFLMLQKAHEEIKIHLSRARELNERLRNAIARAEQTETEECPPKQRKIADNLITNHPASGNTAKRLCQVIPVACIVLPSNIAYTQQITTVCGCPDTAIAAAAADDDDDDAPVATFGITTRSKSKPTVSVRVSGGDGDDGDGDGDDGDDNNDGDDSNNNDTNDANRGGGAGRGGNNGRGNGDDDEGEEEGEEEAEEEKEAQEDDNDTDGNKEEGDDDNSEYSFDHCGDLFDLSPEEQVAWMEQLPQPQNQQLHVPNNNTGVKLPVQENERKRKQKAINTEEGEKEGDDDNDAAKRFKPLETDLNDVSTITSKRSAITSWNATVLPFKKRRIIRYSLPSTKKKKEKEAEEEKEREHQDNREELEALNGKMKQKRVDENKYLPFTFPKEWPKDISSNNVITPWEELSLSQNGYASWTSVMSNIDPMVRSRLTYDPRYKQWEDGYDGKPHYRFDSLPGDKTINDAIDLDPSESVKFFLSINNTISGMTTDTSRDAVESCMGELVDKVCQRVEDDATKRVRERFVGNLIQKCQLQKDGGFVFDWHGFGIQAGICFNAAPSNVSFLNGPLLEKKQTSTAPTSSAAAAAAATTTTTTVQRIESMINDEKGMTQTILMILRRPTMDYRVRKTSKSIQQALCENFELDASNLNTQQYTLITKHIDRLKLLPVNHPRKSPRKKGIKLKIAGTVQFKKKTVIKKGTTLKRDKSKNLKPIKQAPKKAVVSRADRCANRTAAAAAAVVAGKTDDARATRSKKKQSASKPAPKPPSKPPPKPVPKPPEQPLCIVCKGRMHGNICSDGNVDDVNGMTCKKCAASSQNGRAAPAAPAKETNDNDDDDSTVDPQAIRNELAGGDRVVLPSTPPPRTVVTHLSKEEDEDDDDDDDADDSTLLPARVARSKKKQAPKKPARKKPASTQTMGRITRRTSSLPTPPLTQTNTRGRRGQQAKATAATSLPSTRRSRRNKPPDQLIDDDEPRQKKGQDNNNDKGKDDTVSLICSDNDHREFFDDISSDDSEDDDKDKDKNEREKDNQEIVEGGGEGSSNSSSSSGIGDDLSNSIDDPHDGPYDDQDLGNYNEEEEEEGRGEEGGEGEEEDAAEIIAYISPHVYYNAVVMYEALPFPPKHAVFLRGMEQIGSPLDDSDRVRTQFGRYLRRYREGTLPPHVREPPLALLPQPPVVAPPVVAPPVAALPVAAPLQALPPAPSAADTASALTALYTALAEARIEWDRFTKRLWNANNEREENHYRILIDGAYATMLKLQEDIDKLRN